MSKVVMSLPKGMARDVAVGAVVSLGTYVGLQFLWALLIDRGLLGLERLYPLVCIAAGAASFLGCVSALLGAREGTLLPVPVVVAVFMTLTLTAALLTAETISIENGVTGLGLSMAAGGLLAALVGGKLPRGSRQNRRHSRPSGLSRGQNRQKGKSGRR